MMNLAVTFQIGIKSMIIGGPKQRNLWINQPFFYINLFNFRLVVVDWLNDGNCIIVLDGSTVL